MDTTGKRFGLLGEVVRPMRLVAVLWDRCSLLNWREAEAAAASRRLPAMYGMRIYVEAGRLMAYGTDLLDNWRRSVVFVDRILKGARPADLPVEQATKFNWVINLKVAKALDLTIAQSDLLRADEVIA